MEAVSSDETLIRHTNLYGVISQQTDILKILKIYFMLRGNFLVY